MALFESKEAIEKVLLTFDFTPILPTGVTLTGLPDVIITTHSGIDDSPSAVLNAPPFLSDDKLKVYVSVAGGVPNDSYLVTVSCATTDQYRSVSLPQVLPIKPDSTGADMSNVNYYPSCIPAGLQDGVNMVYTLPKAPIGGSMDWFVNGAFQNPGTDYTLVGNTITKLGAPLGSTDTQYASSFRY